MSAAVANIVPSSAAPALSLLDEPEPALRAHALRSLDALADSFWPEISGVVDKIQVLAKDPSFPERALASIVAAKINFHLGALENALHYALAAGSLFNVDEQTQFAITLRALCIDEYIALRSNPHSDSAIKDYKLELEAVVERVLDNCLTSGEVNEAIGVALESHRLDKVELAVINGCKTDPERKQALAYCFECAQTLVTSRGYRTTVLSLISDMHLKHFSTESRDHFAVANCYAFVGNAKGAADVLLTLVRESATASTPQKKDELELTALQIAFDIVDNDAPFFASEITKLLPNPRPTPVVEQSTANASGGATSMESETPNSNPTPEPVTPRSRVSTVEMSPADTLIEKLREILSGSVTASLSLDFLCSHNRSDVPMLKKIKQGLDGRSSVCHSALVFANAIAHSGTAIDTFLRDNLDWLARATAWAKFSATSCLGVIHARHTSSALNLLSPYLPSSAGLRSTSSASSYSEGGALYALGLIAATGGRDAQLPPAPGGTQSITAKAYLLQALQAQGAGDVVKHGASLGLGLSAMASWDGGEVENEYYEDLKALLYTDSAVASEAAALGMGLIALGSGSERVCDEMLAYARETEHEKIIRGLAVGIALVCYGRQDDADAIIHKLKTDKDPILRYGAMYAVALAYCGTADNQAIKMLLHSAVTDVNDDVRRAAVIALGFVLFRHPKQLPRIVSLLSESCHAHVRYGAAMAIGIACMGSGSTVAVDILEKLSIDSTDFVRQGALIGLSLVYMHHTDERSPKSNEIRKLLEITRSAKLEEVVARFGAVVASGVIDAGGRNGKISFTSANGHPRMSAIVGMAMFTQFWYWYPLVHFIGLSIQPSALIAVNKELKMPKMKIMSNASAPLFEYVPCGPAEKQKELTRAPAAILSVTASSRIRQAKKAAKRKAENSVEPMTDVKEAVEDKKDKKDGKKEDAEEEKKNVPSYSILENPCRVLPGQEYAIEWEISGELTASEGSVAASDNRYTPVMPNRKCGVVLVRDRKKGDVEEFVEMQSLSASAPTAAVGTPTARTLDGNVNEEEEITADEADPPEPFQYKDEEESGDRGEDGKGAGGDSTMTDAAE